MFQPDNYRKFLLNRATTTLTLIDYIENCITNNDKEADYAFHKIIVLHFIDKDVNLFNIISEYFGSYLVPVQYQTQNIVTTFYTSNLNLILKIIKLDFIFPYNRNMYNIDILFNDKSSVECFGSKITVDDIVAGVVSRRLNENWELDLSDFCNDPDFKEHNIYFYKVSLLSNFKLLMLRMGKDTKKLNLSKNNLKQVPQDILNFFIKGGLVAIDFSNNIINSLNELQRVNSRIEQLWLEGNPLCDELDATSYIKQLLLKFPRLVELDGIRINNNGLLLPLYKNYLITPDRRTKVVVEKFINLYFAHFDVPPQKRDKLLNFYTEDAHLSISANLSDSEPWPKVYQQLVTNLLDANAVKPVPTRNRRAVIHTLTMLPTTVHDLTSFSVDVLLHNKKHLMVVIDGVFQEVTKNKTNNSFDIQKRHLSFRRTFLLTISFSDPKNSTSNYRITKEMLTLSLATLDQVNNFKEPARSMDSLALVNPDRDDINTLSAVFMHITQLKNMELCEQRLKASNWDLKLALEVFQKDLQNNVINLSKFEKSDNDDFTDTSSLLEDELD